MTIPSRPHDSITPSALVVGATSLIARSLCSSFAASGIRLILAGRDRSELEAVAADIDIRHGVGRPEILFFDAERPQLIDAAARELLDRGRLPRDLVFVLGLAEKAERAPSDPELCERLHAANYTGIVRFLAMLLPELEFSSRLPRDVHFFCCR